MRTRRVGALLAVTMAVLGSVTPLAAGPNSTQLVSRPTGFGPLPPGGDSGGAAEQKAVSGNGDSVVFTSGSDDLGVNDEFVHVWLRTGGQQTRLLDRAPDGKPGNGRFVSSASISRDGSTVCFRSDATNLVPGVSGRHIYVVRVSTGATTVADRGNTATGEVGNDVGLRCALDAAGSRVAFSSRASNLVANDTNNTDDIFVRDLGAATTQRVSVDSVGAQAPSFSSDPAISADGLKVAFATSSPLLPGETGNLSDVYLRNLQTGTLTRISVGTGSVEGDGHSTRPSLSDDGSMVAFDSTSTNLDLGADTNDRSDVFVRIPGADTTFAVSRASGSGELGDADSLFPAMSGNGSAVAFVSRATNLGAGPSSAPQVYMRTLGTNVTTVVSRASGASGAVADGPASVGAPSLPTTPTSVVWAGLGGNVHPDASGEFGQVYQRRLTGAFETSLVSRPTGDAPRFSLVNGSSVSGASGLSADGRIVVFPSTSDGIDQSAAGRPQQIFARDMTTGATILVSRAAGAAGTMGNANSQQPAVSADGRRVAFVSEATNLLPGGNQPGVFVRDLVSGELFLASRIDGPAGAPVALMTLGGVQPTLNADGTIVAFGAFEKFVPDDANNEGDVYVRDLRAGTTKLASRAQNGAAGNSRSTSPSLSADGTRVAFPSSSTNLLDGGPTPGQHVYVRDLEAGTTTLADRRSSDGAPGSGRAFNAQLDASGTRVLMTADEALTPEPLSGVIPRGLYVRDLADGTTTLASRSDGVTGAPAEQVSNVGALSADGRHVAFSGSGADLQGGSGLIQAYARDLAAATTRLVSAVDGGATPANAASTAGSLSADGGCVSFSSAADNLTTPGYLTRDFSQVYLRAVSGDCPRTTPAVTAVTTTPPAADPRPVISQASMSRTRFRLGPKPTATAAAVRRAPRGTTFRYTLSEAATLRIAIAQRLAGRRSGTRCVKPTRALRRKRACVRLVTRVTLRRAAKAGRSSTAFSGRFGRRSRLSPGAHQATLTATDAAGQRAAARTLRFTVVR